MRWTFEELGTDDCEPGIPNDIAEADMLTIKQSDIENKVQCKMQSSFKRQTNFGVVSPAQSMYLEPHVKIDLWLKIVDGYKLWPRRKSCTLLSERK